MQLCVSWINAYEAPNTPLLFKPAVQMQPVSPHNGIFTLSYSFLGCPPWWKVLLQAQLSLGEVSTPACWELAALRHWQWESSHDSPTSYMPGWDASF